MNRVTLRSVRCSGGQQRTHSCRRKSSSIGVWIRGWSRGSCNRAGRPHQTQSPVGFYIWTRDRLPTVRRLAEHLSINLHTVRSAYQKLEMQGLVETRRGRGTHVLSFDPRLVAQAAGPLRMALCARSRSLAGVCRTTWRWLGSTTFRTKSLWARSPSRWTSRIRLTRHTRCTS